MRRYLVPTAIFLLAGLVVNIALASACALGADPTVHEPDVGVIVTSADSWEVARSRGFGVTLYMTTWAKGGELPRPHRYGEHPGQLVPKWSGLAEPSAEFQRRTDLGPRDLLIEYRNVMGFGWPMRALWHEPSSNIGDGDHQLTLPSQGGYVDTALPRWAGVFPRGIPLRITDMGFLINTLFYGAILWLLIGAPFVIRRAIRRRSGRCPSCGYQLRQSSACPECGNAIAAGPVA